VIKILAILKETGDIKERIQDFDKQQVVNNILQLYLKRTNQDDLRQQSLDLITLLAANSE
jgi:hypothetical protein